MAGLTLPSALIKCNSIPESILSLVLIHKHFGFDNVGFHLGTDESTLDFNGFLTEENLRKIEQEANEAVVSNRKIEIFYPSQEERAELEYRSKIQIDTDLRIVRIPGYDVCACCAPHVVYTGEIGLIKLVSASKYKGGTRVHMLCGFRALEDYNKKEKEHYRDIRTVIRKAI